MIYFSGSETRTLIHRTRFVLHQCNPLLLGILDVQKGHGSPAGPTRRWAGSVLDRATVSSSLWIDTCPYGALRVLRFLSGKSLFGEYDISSDHVLVSPWPSSSLAPLRLNAESCTSRTARTTAEDRIWILGTTTKQCIKKKNLVWINQCPIAFSKAQLFSREVDI